MEREAVTIIVSANRPELVELYPISRGPYAGIDYLYIEPDLCGRYYVRRHGRDGTLLVDYDKLPNYDAALDKVKELRREQNRKDCNAVTGNGRWGCD